MNHEEMKEIKGHKACQAGLQLTSPLPRTGVVEEVNDFINDWVHGGGRNIGENHLDEAQDTICK